MSGVSTFLRSRSVDPAPLKRAGLLTVLLIALVAASRWMGPAAMERPADSGQRQTGPALAEGVSAPSRSSLPGGVALLSIVLVGGGLAALVASRRRGGREATPTEMEVLETLSLGPGQSLRLVACGREVLLFSVTGEGAQFVRQWDRATFDGSVDLREAAGEGTPPAAEVVPDAAPSAETPRVAEVAPPEPTPAEAPSPPPPTSRWIVPTPPAAAPPVRQPAAPVPRAGRADEAEPAPTESVLPQFAAPAEPAPAPTLSEAPAFATVLRQFAAAHA